MWAWEMVGQLRSDRAGGWRLWWLLADTWLWLLSVLLPTCGSIWLICYNAWNQGRSLVPSLSLQKHKHNWTNTPITCTQTITNNTPPCVHPSCCSCM